MGSGDPVRASCRPEGGGGGCRGARGYDGLRGPSRAAWTDSVVQPPRRRVRAGGKGRPCGACGEVGVDSYGRMGEGNNLPSPVGGRAAEHGCEGVKAPLNGSVISVAPTLRRSKALPREKSHQRRRPCASPAAPVGQGELRGVDPSPCRILPVLWGLVHDEERSPPQNLFSVQRTPCFVPTEADWSSSPSPLASACPWRSFEKSGRASPMRGG